MIRPDPKIVKALAVCVRQYPELLEWVNNWRQHELEQLPNVSNNVALAQGRCQVLSELAKLMNESPDLAAKS